MSISSLCSVSHIQNLLFVQLGFLKLKTEKCFNRHSPVQFSQKADFVSGKLVYTLLTQSQ